ncbi:hypothetical protein [Bacillus cereus]|uniref:DUF3953 domain-containing protein n=1 Tax=Bacillus cereus (strain ZK / E33L) TaxID=288681 RepID=Q4V1G4_BACCZ|nr:hypothetical protein [Bacillus cereus]AAY60443.1 conserved hypothetical protein [Bacillus cereus E33L]
MNNQEDSMGLFAFIVFLIGVITFVLYIFTGNTIISDTILMITMGVTLVLSLILSVISRKNRWGKFSLYGSGSVIGLIILFYIAMSIIWNQP